VSNFRLKLLLWKYKLIELPHKVKCSIWNRGILLMWYRLYIRQDDMHVSLDIDIEAVVGMSEVRYKRYMDSIVKRRRIAHLRSMYTKTEYKALVAKSKAVPKQTRMFDLGR
jgi:hypothetical protein